MHSARDCEQISAHCIICFTISLTFYRAKKTFVTTVPLCQFSQTRDYTVATHATKPATLIPARLNN